MTFRMRVNLAETRDRIPLDRETWNSLVDGNPVHTAFQTYEWFDTWWAAFGARYELHFLTLSDSGEAVGFVPLMRTRGALGLRHLELAGTPNADYQDLVIPSRRAEAIAALCGFLHENRKSWDMVVLRSLPADSPTIPELSAECARIGLGITDIEREPCPAIEIRGHEGTVQKTLNRYSVRRAVRRLERRGPLSFSVADDPETIEQLLPEYFDQHVRRWRSSRKGSPFTDETFRRWYHNLARAAGQAGWLHFSVLRCGQAAAAFHFGFSYGDTLSWYKPSYEPDFAQDSPGTTLICKLVENAVHRNLRVFDFAAGREPFKSRFSNVERECLNFRIFSDPGVHAVFRAGAEARRLLRNQWYRGRRQVRNLLRRG